MSYREFHENIRTFVKLTDQVYESGDEQVNLLINNYIHQNLDVLNEVLSTSIENMRKLQKVKTANDIISIQATFTDKIGKTLSYATQHFLNNSLGRIADYNEWLKTHCDLATD